MTETESNKSYLQRFLQT